MIKEKLMISVLGNKKGKWFFIKLIVVGIILMFLFIFYCPWLLILNERPPKNIRLMVNLDTALRDYRLCYQKLPLQDVLGDKDVLITPAQYKAVMKELGNQVNKIDSDEEVFLEINSDGTYIDMWGSEYRIVYDLDGDEYIAPGLINGIDVKYYCGPSGYMFWSLGPDGKEETPYVKSKTGLNKDNEFWRSSFSASPSESHQKEQAE